MCLMIRRWISARMDKGFVRERKMVKSNRIQILFNRTLSLSPAMFYRTVVHVQVAYFLSVWQMCLSRYRQTCWPRLRPNTDWKMRFRGIDTVVSRPSECRLIHLPVCLRYSTCNILHSLLPAHHFCISIHLSQPGHHSAVLFFFSLC